MFHGYKLLGYQLVGPHGASWQAISRHQTVATKSSIMLAINTANEQPTALSSAAIWHMWTAESLA